MIWNGTKRHYRPSNHQQCVPCNDCVIMNIATKPSHHRYRTAFHVHSFNSSYLGIYYLSKWLTVINSCPFCHYFGFRFSPPPTMAKTFILTGFFNDANRCARPIWFVTYWMKITKGKVMWKQEKLQFFASAHVHHIHTHDTLKLRLHINPENLPK